MRLRVVARIALRYSAIYVSLLMLAFVWVATSGMDVYHRTEGPEFCNACHEMNPNFKTWANSRHGNIKCVDCHARPGFSGWIQAKMAGTAQLVSHLSAESIEDIHLLQHHKEIVSENCQRCHEDSARIADRRGRAIAHKRHGELNVACIECHSGNVAHPTEEEAKHPVRGLVEVAACFKCHDGKNSFQSPQGPRVAFAAVDEKSCEKCHPDSKSALEHGKDDPKTTQRKPCLDCHEQAPSGTHYAMDRKDQGKLCAKCHEPEKKAEFASVHEPFAKGKCDECHKVMASAYLFRDGPKVSKAFCLGCHDNVAGALALPQATTKTMFADGATDLHRSHADDASDEGERLCLACHAPHGSKATRGLVHLRPDGDGAEPGTFTATATGGTCGGSCHDGDDRTYDRVVKPAAAADSDEE